MADDYKKNTILLFATSNADFKVGYTHSIHIEVQWMFDNYWKYN